LDENGEILIKTHALTVTLVITLNQAHKAYGLRDLLFEQGG
jgi:hypothetical protein